MSIEQALKVYLLEQGASDVGFGCVCKEDAAEFGGLGYFVSIAVKLSDAIIDEIDGAPTHSYFNHYRSVNALIDQLLLKAGLFLDKAGHRYITVAASQSINQNGWNYDGRYSHKKAACLAGLGGVGKSSLFLHHRYGARVRLGTVFTNCVFPASNIAPTSVCGACDLCVRACPSGAILGGAWSTGVRREDIFAPEKCSSYMKRQFQHIGRGAVCGLCIKACPYHK